MKSPARRADSGRTGPAKKGGAEPRPKSPSIGTRCESSLHRTLKFRYASGGETETAIAGFVADGVNRDGEFIEVQTGSFAPLKKKMSEFAALGRVKIIHPVIINTYIEVYDEGGKRLYRRKSPRHGSEWDLFDNLLYAPELPLIPGLRIELAVVDTLEKRIRDGKGSWRRRGISIVDREMSAWHGCLSLDTPGDYRRFIPFEETEQFTAACLAGRANIKAELARKTLYVLVRLGTVRRVGKKGRFWLYEAGGYGNKPFAAV
jgi:hypothetical protein